MLKRKVSLLFPILASLALITSCVKDAEIDQAEIIDLNRTVASSLIFTEVEASRFSENGSDIVTVRDSVANIEIFNDQLITDNLKKAELFFEANNTINSIFNLRVDFLNDVDQLQHTLSFDAQNSTTGNIVMTEYIEIFEDDSLEALRSVKKMMITLTLYPNSDGYVLNDDSIGEIVLESKGIFHFDTNI